MDIDGGNSHEVLGQEVDVQHIRGQQGDARLDAEEPGHEDVLSQPQPTYSPTFSSPEVDWSEVRFKPTLPKPEEFAVYGVSQDPAFYKPSQGTRSRILASPVRFVEKAAFEKQFPFGSISGYNTSMGPVRKPNIPINGYILGEDDQWTIAALPPRGTTPGRRRKRRK